MPVTWKIWKTVLEITISGQSENFRTAIAAAMSSPAFPQRPSVLIDVRATTENPSAEELRESADRILVLLSHRAGSRCAVVVAPKPHHYGLARMFAVFLGAEDVHTEIFTDLDEAKRWLTPATGQTISGAAG